MAKKKKHKFDEKRFIVEPKEKLNLSKRPNQAGKELGGKDAGIEALAQDVSYLQLAQEVLYASGSHSLLLIFQGMDAAGKDSTIRHVMGAINPQGCRVYSFKAPNDTELQHHFLWRPMPCLPGRGMISIFNRSYYEETLVVRVHPEFLGPQKIPGVDPNKPKSLGKLWRQRYREINAFESSLVANGTLVLKFFLHVSPDEQRERFMDRLTESEKHWKFNSGDLAERKLWPQYQMAFEETLSNTSTKAAPWFVIPADNKWYMRAAIADIIAARLEDLDLDFPEVDPEEAKQFDLFIEQLRNEK